MLCVGFFFGVLFMGSFTNGWFSRSREHKKMDRNNKWGGTSNDPVTFCLQVAKDRIALPSFTPVPTICSNYVVDATALGLPGKPEDVEPEVFNRYASDDELLYVDVGANTGQVLIPSLQMRPLMRAVAFEPGIATCAELKKNVVNAGLTTRVKIVCKAVAAQKGTATLGGAGGASTSFSLIAKTDPGTVGSKAAPTVATVTIDDEVGSDQSLFMLKTDTQGFEKNVLLGAQNLLQQHRVRFVLVEVSNMLLKGQFSSPEEIVTMLTRQFGYQCAFLSFHSTRKKGDGEPQFFEVKQKIFGDNVVSINALTHRLTEVLVEGGFAHLSWTDLLCF